MSDQLEVLKLVVQRLDASGVAYMVTGSLAASYYAVPRFTRDIDVVVELDRPSADRLAESLAADFYVDAQALQQAVERGRMTNVIHQQRLVKVDLIVRRDTPYRREEFKRRQAAVIDGVNVWFVSVEDLVLSKLLWMRDSQSEMQRRDVENLLSAVANLDREYIERWARELGILSAWLEISNVDR